MNFMLMFIKIMFNVGLDDCKELKPTNIPMVPRLLNKLYDKVTSEIGGNKLKLLLLKRAVASKEYYRKR